MRSGGVALAKYGFDTLRAALGRKGRSTAPTIWAAERLRRGDYYCRRLGPHLSWTGDLGGWWDEMSFHETGDTGS